MLMNIAINSLTVTSADNVRHGERKRERITIVQMAANTRSQTDRYMDSGTLVPQRDVFDTQERHKKESN